MPYGDIISYDAATKETTFIPVTNAWVLANKSNCLSVTVDAAQMALGATTNIYFQLVTPLLIDDSRDNVAQATTVTIDINGVENEVQLDSTGYATDIISGDEVGIYTIIGVSHALTQLIEIEVI